MQILDNAPATDRPVEGRVRAVVKTLLYRVLMIAITIAVAYAVTGEVVTAVNIGIAANVVKTLVYYCYERAWARVAWGIA